MCNIIYNINLSGICILFPNKRMGCQRLPIGLPSIMKEEKMQILCLVGITVSEVLVMAKITCNGTKRNTLFNPSSPMSHQDRISPYNVNTISIRQVMRMKKNIN